ncbi:DUF1836 domain-containing protein [Caproicibacterium amylolyticum]|uniref:DUF1836 domain-containing protein n=1 Tax=Caproicibacterium amylolyticum TaxID=2766537 RepID=A0A7G9WK93_9FIRM|nr:DUF1836 domain-containing protein [Caproicibacterium amylolyticum]QNO19105.1 DUF1836 domain-containing protein [Caproicibacterium amylolyticum]
MEKNEFAPLEELSQWTHQVADGELTPWDRFPEIYLYMDQVLTFMETQLHLFEQEGSPLLTSSMVNNYVKDGVLPRPEKKKYSRSHLVQLTILCLLKQVLSIPNIHLLLNDLERRGDMHTLYDCFCTAQEKAFQEVCSRTDCAAADGKDALVQLALQLSVEAGARRTAAEKILSDLQKQKQQLEEEMKEQAKEKEKSKSKDKESDTD